MGLPGRWALALLRRAGRDLRLVGRLPLAPVAGRRATPRGTPLARPSGRWRLAAWLIVTVVIHNYKASQIATFGDAAFGGRTLLAALVQPGWSGEVTATSSLRRRPPAWTVDILVPCSQDV